MLAASFRVVPFPQLHRTADPRPLDPTPPNPIPQPRFVARTEMRCSPYFYPLTEERGLLPKSRAVVQSQQLRRRRRTLSGWGRPTPAASSDSRPLTGLPAFFGRVTFMVPSTTNCCRPLCRPCFKPPCLPTPPAPSDRAVCVRWG